MDRDGVFLSVALTNRYNLKKTDDPAALAADRDETVTRPRRASKARRASVDAALVDAEDPARADDGMPTEEPALIPAR